MSNPDVTQRPSAESILAGDEQGFDIFDNTDAIQEMNEKMAEQQNKLNKKYAAVFNNQKGKEVLQDLLDRYIKQQSFDPREENAEAVGYYREGQKATVADIFQRINQGMNKEEQ